MWEKALLFGPPSHCFGGPWGCSLLLGVVPLRWEPSCEGKRVQVSATGLQSQESAINDALKKAVQCTVLQHPLMYYFLQDQFKTRYFFLSYTMEKVDLKMSASFTLPF